MLLIGGVISVLDTLRDSNDLGHPLCNHLRQGDWLANYLCDRMRLPTQSVLRRLTASMMPQLLDNQLVCSRSEPETAFPTSASNRMSGGGLCTYDNVKGHDNACNSANNNMHRSGQTHGLSRTGLLVWLTRGAITVSPELSYFASLLSKVLQPVSKLPRYLVPSYFDLIIFNVHRLLLQEVSYVLFFVAHSYFF
ncbi:unnamed protein product [Protopolystoma xenopodis]|uniref:Glycogen debranching enzyme central domain-containing protein n=1 Tax=Protopolystoma xenopodis TaxID=117903 RepID=A0A448X7F9_9PLAT|nr:unnamed protein product [Protopolystoma xenopodis]